MLHKKVWVNLFFNLLRKFHFNLTYFKNNLSKTHSTYTEWILFLVGVSRITQFIVQCIVNLWGNNDNAWNTDKNKIQPVQEILVVIVELTKKNNTYSFFKFMHFIVIRYISITWPPNNFFILFSPIWFVIGSQKLSDQFTQYF